LRDGSASDAILQFVCCFLALYILYRLAVPHELTDPAQRTVLLASFLAFLQLPLAFVVYQQRPETMPTALFFAVFLLCITKARHGWQWTVLLLFSTAVQGFVRPDVPFIAGLSLALLSFRSHTLTKMGSRTGNMLRGLGISLVALAVQLYLQFVRFPHLAYETGSPIVFRQNFYPGHFSVLGLAFAPFILISAVAATRRECLTELDKIACVATILYLPLWLTIGVIAEVRIGVPLLLGLCPMASRISTAYLLRSSSISVRDTDDL
jgi:hypothetical protein